MSLRIVQVSDVQEAQSLWEIFSPGVTIDDRWDFRFAFFRYLKSEPCFVVGYDGMEPVVLVPLQKSDPESLPAPYALPVPHYEFFGGDDTDDNVIFAKSEYEASIPEVLDHIPRPVVLAPLAQPYSSSNATTSLYAEKYQLPLEGFTSLDDYLRKSFDGKQARALGTQMRKLQRDHKVIVHHNRLNDLERLFDLNLKRFGKDSSFNWPNRKQIFRDLAQLFPAEIISIEVDGQIEAVSYAIRRSDAYVSMNVGVNNEVRNLGKFLNLTQIERAIELGLKQYDAGKGDSGGWKTQLRFTSTPQYKLELL